MGQYFVNPDAKWNITQLGWSIIEPERSYITWEYKLAEETIIDSLSYLRLFKRQFQSQPEWEGEDIYFRESEGKVYKYDESLGQEGLIYDFSIQEVGDFVELSMGYPLAVTAIDSIEWLDGSKKRRITFLVADFDLDKQVYWVDGIGDIVNSIAPVNLYPIPADAAIDTLDCFYLTNEMMYQRPGVEDCYRYDIISSEPGVNLLKAEFKAFPNPVEGQLTITAINDKMISLFIYDTSGRLLYENNNLESTQEEIDASNFAGGVYFIKMITKKSGTQIRKVIKK